ncbi:hypothetical protein K474DRAFT_1677656 [Panus rudis PR-1116 ss-1]|nr:hypothetical protein K474DRAFT_1677656 [Panus rudis PR-1116 ss-1]
MAPLVEVGDNSSVQRPSNTEEGQNRDQNHSSYTMTNIAVDQGEERGFSERNGRRGSLHHCRDITRPGSRILLEASTGRIAGRIVLKHTSSSQAVRTDRAKRCLDEWKLTKSIRWQGFSSLRIPTHLRYMATLVRPSTSATSTTTRDTNDNPDFEYLAKGVPTPFPARFEREQELDVVEEDGAREDAKEKDLSPVRVQANEPGPSTLRQAQEEVVEEQSEELPPSIDNLRTLCLTTLNDLLLTSSAPPTWSPIVPDRRRSMPSSPSESHSQPPSALQTLVSNLRAQELEGQMTQVANSSSETELLRELKTRVDRLSPSLDARKALLAHSLVSLLEGIQSLCALYPSSLSTRANATSPRVSSWSYAPTSSTAHTNSISNPFADPSPFEATDSDTLTRLRRQVDDFQLERFALLEGSQSQSQLGNYTTAKSQSSPEKTVHTALLWSRVDEDLETVLSLCRDNSREIRDGPASLNGLVSSAASLNTVGLDHLPPEYDAADFEQHHDDMEGEGLPQYEALDPSSAAQYYGDKSSSHSHKESQDLGDRSSILQQQSSSTLSEKMRMDLEAVTMAIDRLYMVAPQLHNQRVELKKAKLEQMERAKGKGKVTVNGDVDKEKDRKDKGKEKAKGKVTEARELERMVELIGKASERKLADQSVELSESMKRRMEQARLRDIEQRKEFVEHLMEHNGAGRLSSQDARPPHLTRSLTENQTFDSMRDPHALLSLPEFIKESIPPSIRRQMDQDEEDEAMLSLPEFVREPIPERFLRKSASTVAVSRHARGQSTHSSPQSPATNGTESPSATSATGLVHPKAVKAGKVSRSRSLSAPPLAWLLASAGSGSRSGSPSANGVEASGKKSRGGRNTGSRPVSSHGRIQPIAEQEQLEVTFVAEHHENLHHILLFMTIKGIDASASASANHQVSAEVIGPGNKLVIECASGSSLPLELPAYAQTGKKEALRAIKGDQFELKLPTSPHTPPPDANDLTSTSTLLDATHLSHLSPTSLICSSCSLPLVQTSKLPAHPNSYRDLPSDHWAELVDAWMCHADLKLNEHVKKGSKEGFWPGEGEVLVGGSYVLVRESVVVVANLGRVKGEGDLRRPHRLHAASSKPLVGFELVVLRHDDWHGVRCICGALVGRCQTHTPSDGAPVLVYRFAKYAFRPISPSSEPLKIPLSAFIVEDMTEFVQAHATYRFVIVDEEEDRPRILLWLFKPNMRLSYATPSRYFIPKDGSIRAAKVLYKLLVPSPPSEVQTIINRYPGFPQAEHLYYPIDICRRLAGLLKESTTAYPESMRTMTGLDVGWLQRT